MSLDYSRCRRVGRWFGGILAGLIVAVGAIGFYLWTWQPDPLLYPLRGIDVSHHQGAIDWPTVARSDISFAYLKASEGGDYLDPSFTSNLAAARRAGLWVGAYHFFTLCRSGGDQARHFLAVLGGSPSSARLATDLPAKNLPAKNLPVVVDLEFGGNCAARPSPAALQGELAAFLAMVEGTLGQKVVIYATDEFDSIYGTVLPPRPRWRRSLFQLPAEPGWVLWQYHNAGHVAGIAGRVDLDVIDLDVYCGDAAGRPISGVAGSPCSANRARQDLPSGRTGSR